MSNLRYSPSSNHRQKFCCSALVRVEFSIPLNFFFLRAFRIERSSVTHSCRTVSHESRFCRKSPGTLLLCFYWRFMINQRRDVLTKLWKQKKSLAFSASVSSLDESMKPFRIDLKFGPEASYDTNLKQRVGLFRFSKLISRNTIRRNVYW